MELFGSSGTRGTVGEAMTPSLVLRVARAAGTVWDADEVAVARDTRTSGEMLTAAAASGLASVGVDAVLLGCVPTPGVTGYCEREGAPALVVTASHNPPAYNGVKLLGADGVELTVDALERVERHVFDEPVAEATWEAVGNLDRVEDANRRYVADLLAASDRRTIADADLTVALDPGHGAGALTSPDFLRRLGCEVVTANAQPDGHFPGRDPEPIPENLGDLRRLVRAADADLGVAHDGDADRAIFVDETGEVIPGEASLAALVAAELDPGDAVVAAVNASQRLVDVVEAADARLELTPIGATNLVTRIRELRDAGVAVPVAGEGNGGVYFPDFRLARDGAHAAARFLELVAERPASEVVEPHLDYHLVRRSVEYGTDRERERLLDAAADYAAAAPVDPDTTDGYRLDFGDAWMLVRPSGTEPKVRVYAEARDPDRAASLADELVSVLQSAR
ncbi:MAG: phosphoglucosamine mutase [Haloferacaceae archaeon]